MNISADGLKEVLVNNYDEINARMEEGTVNTKFGEGNCKQRNNKKGDLKYNITGQNLGNNFEQYCSMLLLMLYDKDMLGSP